jgi:hypothetical protein
VLRHLTNQVADNDLRSRIRQLAHIFILEPRFRDPAAWPMAS